MLCSMQHQNSVPNNSYFNGWFSSSSLRKSRLGIIDLYSPIQTRHNCFNTLLFIWYWVPLMNGHLHSLIPLATIAWVCHWTFVLKNYQNYMQFLLLIWNTCFRRTFWRWKTQHILLCVLLWMWVLSNTGSIFSYSNVTQIHLQKELVTCYWFWYCEFAFFHFTSALKANPTQWVDWRTSQRENAWKHWMPTVRF